MTGKEYLEQKFKEFYESTAHNPYAPRHKIVLIVCHDLYHKLHAEKAILPDLTTFDADDKQQYTFMGIPIVYISDREEMSDDANIMLEKEWNALQKKRAMYHRLATNGEWLAKGSSSRKREQIIKHEADSFAEMCAGYEHWEILVKQYLNDYPNPPHEVILKTWDSKL